MIHVVEIFRFTQVFYLRPKRWKSPKELHLKNVNVMMSNNATFLSFTVIFTCNFVQKCCMRIGILYNKNPFSLRHWDTSYLFSSKIFGLAYVVIKKENFLVSAIFHTSRDTMKCISGPRVLLFHSVFSSSNVVHQVI